MLGKLTKAEEKQIDAAASALSVAIDSVEALIEQEHEYADEEAWQEGRAQLRDLLDTLVDSTTPIVSFFEDVVNDQREAFDAKSDKWREGDKAANIDQWLGGLEDLSQFNGADGCDMMEGVQDPDEYPAKVRFSESIDLGEYRDLLDGINDFERQAEA